MAGVRLGGGGYLAIWLFGYLGGWGEVAGGAGLVHTTAAIPSECRAPTVSPKSVGNENQIGSTGSQNWGCLASGCLAQKLGANTPTKKDREKKKRYAPALQKASTWVRLKPYVQHGMNDEWRDRIASTNQI